MAEQREAEDTFGRLFLESLIVSHFLVMSMNAQNCLKALIYCAYELDRMVCILQMNIVLK